MTAKDWILLFGIHLLAFLENQGIGLYNHLDKEKPTAVI